MTVHDEFKARLERDVARIMRHIVGSEMDAGELDGQIVLTIQGGQLVGIEFPNAPGGIPPARDPFATPRKRKGRVADEPQGDET